MSAPELHGYHLSVYTWIARLALRVKLVDHTFVNINPFTHDVTDVHPFNRVPVLFHDGFRVYETTAITRYVDHAFPGPALQPVDPRERARGDQIVAIIDNYGYWPLVRQVFTHGYLLPAAGRDADLAELAAGLQAAPRVLAALDTLLASLAPAPTASLSLADIHLAPMIGYFAEAAEGKRLLAGYPALQAWWEAAGRHEAVVATKPELPAPGRRT